MSEMKILDKCRNKCWCHFREDNSNCKIEIKKGDKYLFLWKDAMKGSVRINICSECIKQIYDELFDDEILRLCEETKRTEAKNG